MAKVRQGGITWCLIMNDDMKEIRVLVHWADFFSEVVNDGS